MAKIALLLFSLTIFATEIPEQRFGTSSRNVPLSPRNLKQFAQMGIELTLNPANEPEPEPLTQWEKGLLFLSDFNQKGELFEKWLEISPIRPGKRFVIDREKQK